MQSHLNILQVINNISIITISNRHKYFCFRDACVDWGGGGQWSWRKKLFMWEEESFRNSIIKLSC